MTIDELIERLERMREAMPKGCNAHVFVQGPLLGEEGVASSIEPVSAAGFNEQGMPVITFVP